MDKPDVGPEPRVRAVKLKLLFFCSRNQWRSPTAEALFRDHPRYEARSADTGERARIKVTAGHIGWADLIFCMEKKHAVIVTEHFATELGDKPLIVPRIPDDFQFMDPALVELLRDELSEHLETSWSASVPADTQGRRAETPAATSRAPPKTRAP
jgi:predicted protein tyrosine phosphatase